VGFDGFGWNAAQVADAGAVVFEVVTVQQFAPVAALGDADTISGAWN
jgi:hypothetical protein